MAQGMHHSLVLVFIQSIHYFFFLLTNYCKFKEPTCGRRERFDILVFNIREPRVMIYFIVLFQNSKIIIKCALLLFIIPIASVRQ